MKTTSKKSSVLFFIISILLFSFPIQPSFASQFSRSQIDYHQDLKISLVDAIIAFKKIAALENTDVHLKNILNILQLISGSTDSKRMSAAVLLIKESSGKPQANVPVSIVCKFDPGEVPSDKTLYALPANSRLRANSDKIPAQMNDTEMYGDGSIKRAMVTFMLPQINPNEQQTIQLMVSDQTVTDSPITLENVLNSNFHSTIKLFQNGKTFNASLLNFIQNHLVQEIFSGPICSKWLISGPFIGADSYKQSINASYQLVAYKGCERIRIDACVKNDNKPLAGQYAFYYDLTLSVGDMSYVRKNLPLPPFTHWTKIMWWGQQPSIDIVNGGLDPFYEKTIVQTIISETSISNISNIPVTFGHVFKKGDIQPEHQLKVSSENGSQIPVQLDKKAYYKDGSLRHGIISMIIPYMPEGAINTFSLSVYYADSNETNSAINLSEIIQSQYNSIVTIHIDGKVYQAQSKALLENSQELNWLSGPIVKEWHVTKPLQTENNDNHPHLAAHFYIRSYTGSPWVRTSVIIENNWTYIDAPQNFTYDLTIGTDTQTVYQQEALTHYNHARFRKVFWQNLNTTEILLQQPIHIQHDIHYLMATKAIPNFDHDLIGNIPESERNKTYNSWLSHNAQMSAGLISNWSYGYEMWPVLKWTGQYLLSMDARLRDVMIGNAELSGSFPLHYRDAKTLLPVSINDYPHCTTHWKDTTNPATGLSEAPAKCTDDADCKTPHLIDPERKPAYTFIPYMLTGDYYFLEELHFWANYCFLNEIPTNRAYSKGIVKGDPGNMAFSIRTIGQAAYITPEDHPLKSYFTNKLLENINAYHHTYLEDNFNPLGSATLNKVKNIVLKDDYLTWALGYLVDLDYTAVFPLLSWKTAFPVLRLTSDQDFCWLFASNPYLQVADSSTGSAYDTMKDVYDQSKLSSFLDDGGFECNSQAMADYLKANGKIHYGIIGEMIGKPWASSQPAMIQPALAVAVDADTRAANDAWIQYTARSVIPDYASSGYPNYDIFPRKHYFSSDDTDQDGIIDALDECPGTLKNSSVNRVGCINNDSDNDGIFDYYDACPDSPVNSAINAIGCHDPNQEEPVLETGRIFEVGLDMPYTCITNCPTDDLMPGDEIRVHFKEPPYTDKFLVQGQGTIDQPIKIIGIPDASGKKPVLDGVNAMATSDYICTNEDRQIIKIGQADYMASFIIIDGFEIRNANNTYTFVNASGNDQSYNDNASAIRVENGSNITIRNCIVHHNGNGIQTGKDTHNVLIEFCQIYQNGVCQWENSYIHNMYLSGRNGNTVTVQYNYIGELLSQGQQVKSRAETFVFRYNWLEGGRNAQMDLVEDYDISNTVPYNAYVYGNVIIKPDPSDNSVIIHFGGDQPDTNRLGTLHFYHNTCVIKDTKTCGSRRIFKISSEAAQVIANNNIFYLATPTTYELLSGSLNLSGTNNWLSQSITSTRYFNQSIVGESPDFVDVENDNYQLMPASSCKDAAVIDGFPEELSPVCQYQKHTSYIDRMIIDNAPDMGAFEQGIPSSVTPVADKDKDGIIDNEDCCPNTPPGSLVDDNGCMVTLPKHQVFLSFDSETGDINDGFDNWDYRSPEKDPVYKMNDVEGFYSSPDTQGFHRAFFPYKNISRPRIMRYGYLDINTEMPVRGTGCLKFVFTGGAYLNTENTIDYSGLEVFYKKQFDTYIDSGQSPYATIPLFTDEQFYVKFADSKTRSFDEAQGTDRLSLWIYLPKGSHENSPFPIRTIQYYPYIETSAADHYYHWLTNIGMGGWTHLVIDAHPQRNNTGAPVDENGIPLPYEYYRVGGHDYPGNGVEYFNNTVAFAIRLQLGDYYYPTSVYLDHLTFFKSNQPENDETISNIGVGYNPNTHEFDIGFCDKYRGNGCHATYEVRYSFRPITNASFPKTKRCTVVQAPNLDFTYTTDIKGQIKKPATGYNQLWGLLKLTSEDEQQLKHGTKIYFAVKDVSNRIYPDRDPYDEELVEVENVGQVRRIDLIKTISYEILYNGVRP